MPQEEKTTVIRDRQSDDRYDAQVGRVAPGRDLTRAPGGFAAEGLDLGAGEELADPIAARLDPVQALRYE